MEHLEASSLRIGNYVFTYLSDNADGIEQVTINTLRVMTENPTKKTIYEPTPLTEEFWDRMEYECIQEFIVDLIHLSKHPISENISLWVATISGLKIHEIQNLFKALTGEELTIKDK
jgi:hypothetical protein